MTTRPDIFRYADYPGYLRDAYVARKEIDKKFSHRFIIQMMGAHSSSTGTQSSGWFADILTGRKKLKLRHATPLAAIFKLEPRERDFLRVLIAMEQADSADEKVAAYDKWFELKGVSQEKVARDRFKYFEKWYYPALRELLTLYRFQGDYSDLAAKLNPPIHPREAREAVALLMRLGLINPNAPTPLPVLVMDPTAKTRHRSKILKTYARLALPAHEKFGKEERDFSALTVTLSPEGLKKASEEIAALCRRLLALSERDKTNDRVYQFLFQGFPVSNRVAVPRA